MAVNPVTDLDWKIVSMTVNRFPVITDSEINPPVDDVAVVMVLSYGKDIPERLNRYTNLPERYEKFRQEYRISRSKLHEWQRKSGIDLEAVDTQVVQPAYNLYAWIVGGA